MTMMTETAMGTRVMVAAVLGCLTLNALGCGDGGDEASTVDALSVATFNTGLISVVKGAEAREPEILSALSEQDVDVLCLQELFAPVSTADFADTLAEKFPYSHYSTLGDSAFGNGLLLLSRYPLEAPKAHLFDAVDPLGLTDRMVISADVVLPGQTVHVLCSHLQAGLDDESKAVRGMQVEELVQFAEADGYLDGPTLLLGDFNMGPDPVGACTPDSDPPCLAADEDTYAQLLETFEDPNADWDQCTQCRDVYLPLQVVGVYADEPDQRIDHCFTRALGAWSATGRSTFLADPVSIEIGSGTNGEVLTSLSDHLGVRCDFAVQPDDAASDG